MNDTQLLHPDNAATASLNSNGKPTTDLLPQDLIEEALKRLGILCWIYAVTFLLAFGIDLVLNQPADAALGSNLQFNDVLIAAVSVFIALGYWTMLQARSLPRGTLLQIGLVFESIAAFGIEAGRFWSPTIVEHMGGVSWTCVWIVCFSVIVPMRPKKTLIAAFAAASMGPLALAFAAAFDMSPQGITPAAIAAYFIPGYICVALAYISSQIVYKLGRDVLRARQMGSYELIEKLGSGGMGEVWRAKHRMLARPAAVKLVRPEMLGAEGARAGTVLQRFEREAHATALLRSPHTIVLYDFGKTDTGLLYYAMEYLEGLDLQNLVDNFGSLSAPRTVHLLDQALLSLGEAHTQGLLHRDIKPGNMFLTSQGGQPDFLKILDFGLVKETHRPAQQDAALTGDGAIIGTPLYMAPERFYGDAETDQRADLYALAAVAYFLMSGQPVFEARNPVQILIQQARSQPASLRSRSVQISNALDNLILSALSKEPGSRPENAAAFREQLRNTPEWGRWNPKEAEAWWLDFRKGKVLSRADVLLVED